MDKQEYISGFGEVLLYIIAGALFVVISLLVSRRIRANRPNPEKLSSYESGEEPITSAWTQYNLRFYVVALIFLLFEVELAVLFPWATVFSRKDLIMETNGLWGWISLLEMILFILVLALGLAYAWANGYLDWIRPTPRPTEYKSPVPKEIYDKLR